MKSLILLFFLFSLSLHSEEYSLKWYNTVTILDSIEFEDKSVYNIVRAAGSWEDSDGFYGTLKCIGPNKISSNGDVELEVYCNGYDNFSDTFVLKLIRSSDMNAGVGIAVYERASGKYKTFLGKKCTYAITYLNNFLKGFYKHICR